jgi:hypothetical protein
MEEEPSVQIATLKLSKKDLISLPKYVASFLIELDLCCNDISLFSLIWMQLSNSHRQADNAAKGMITTRKLMCLRHLNSRLFEIKKKIPEFIKLAKPSGDLSNTVEFYEEKRSYIFDAENAQVSKWLRNKVTSHFSGDELLEMITNFPDSHHFIINVHKIDINSVSSLAEEIAFFGKANEREWSIDDFSSFQDWVLNTGSLFVKLRQKLIIDIYQSFLGHLHLQAVDVRTSDHDVRYLGEAYMPIFFLKDTKL